MPFSRYQIRNEFSLADPELYKAADKDDPEALLEGVAMAGLVGVLRQLGDLAEFAAEIFHGLHEEVMVTATRGHGLLVRVQQLESDFPAIERAFLSQTGHSAFFTSSGIGWHPNLQTEQNLITSGDLPRFVMDSYEECRGPPRLFLLDKFDVAGAGACLKRYTDPSFYKVEASSFEMRNTEAQRDKNVRKTKKKGSRWKNGETPDVFQPSHVKLHQLLLEERMQNNASQPARHVKLKKREIKFPFDTETGKGYLETLLSSPPEDKLVHEVPEGNMVNSPRQNGSPFESPSVDKTVSMEHMNNMPGIIIPERPENESGVNSGIEEEVDEKHISVDRNHKADDIISDGYESDDVVSEGENYVDALATMESEIETETETKANSDQTIEQLQSQSSDSESASDEEKIASFTSSDISSTSVDDYTPQAFASTEIPFRPRAAPDQVSDAPVDEGAILEESGAMSSSNCVDVNSPKTIEETQVDSEAIAASTFELMDVHSPTTDDPSLSNRESEDGNSNSTLEISRVEEQPCGPPLEEVDICDADVKKPSEDDVLESKSAGVSYSSEDEAETEIETDLNDRNTVLFESESKAENADDDKSTEENLHILEEEKELPEREPESVVSVSDGVDNNESKDISTCEDEELDEKEEFIEYVEKDEDDDGVSTTNEQGEDGSGVVQDSSASVGTKESSEESFISPESDSIPSAKKESTESGEMEELTESGEKKESDIFTELESVPSAAYDDSNIQFPDSIPTNEIDVDNPSANLDENLFVIEKTDENGDLDFETGNNVASTQSKAQLFDNSGSHSPVSTTEAATILHHGIVTTAFDQDVESKSMNHQEFEDPVESTTSVVATTESTLHVSEEASMADLPQLRSSQINVSDEVNNNPFAPVFPSINMLPQLPPINLEEMPPLPPLPPMQWRMMGKLPNTCPNDAPHNINHFPPALPQTGTHPHPSLDQNEDAEIHKSQRDNYEDTGSSSQVLPTESSLHVEETSNELKLTKEQIGPQPPFDGVQSHNNVISGDEERPNGIRPMKIQRPRTPLIDAVAAHDKSKLRKVPERARPPIQEEEERDTLMQLRKVSERAMPQIPKEEERDTLLEQIRAKSFNLKPAVQTRPSIQGPSTNLRVAAILEKANAIRQAFAGSDDDEDDDDSWSES